MAYEVFSVLLIVSQKTRLEDQDKPKATENRGLQEGGVPTTPTSDISADARGTCRNIHILYIIIGILGLFLAVSFIVNIAQAVTKQTQAATFPSDVCLRGWIKNGHWCYLFSDEQKSMRLSSSNCSSYGASLVTLDSEQEWAFVKKMGQHGEYWIDFQRETVEQPWKWRNGSLVTHIKIGGVGFCAYLNYDGVSSTTCDNIRHWICRKSSDA